MYFKNVLLQHFTLSFLFAFAIGRRSRILDGDEAQPGQFPYAVAIIASDRGFICGGGIIGVKWILSAAHCVTDHNDDQFKSVNYSIIAGTNDFGNEDDSSGIDIDVEAIYIPRQFKLAIRRADIAVLKLAEKLDFEKYNLQQLILPFDDQVFYKIHTQAVVTGFGAKGVEFTINETTKELSDYEIDGKLRFANVDIVDNSEFTKIPHDDYDLGVDHFLAKMRKQSDSSYGVCYGDSGSPVVYKSKIVIGVTVEMFDMCDEHKYPSLYIKVTHYLDFIENAINDRVTDKIRVQRF